MAIIHPTGWRELRASGSAAREFETLAELERGLPDTYTVYHGVHWTRLHGGFSVYGEVDFMVVAPNARVLLIEQKSGFLEETEHGLQKNYRGEKKSVVHQIARSVEHLQARYGQGNGGARMNLDFMLYCPDYLVRNPHIAGLDPQLIVDARRREQLCAVIQSTLAPGPDLPELALRVHKFCRGILDLVPEIGAVSDEARALYSRISEGLATWGRRIDFAPFRLRVIGTAGSGKTQLALAALHDAAAAGRRALYVCFNRPLAEHLAQLVPAGTQAMTYHQLCDRVLRGFGHAPDFAAPDAFARLEAAFAECEPGRDWVFDELLVDEGQDFRQEWVGPLLRLLTGGGRAWWLEDPMQNLYGRAPVDLPGWTVLHADTNFRSPQDILRLLNRLIELDRPIDPGSPLDGSDVEILDYADSAGLIEQTRSAITRCIGLGFKRSMIAVLTYRGRESSLLAAYDAIGPHTFRRFTGQYDLFGSPVFTAGDITLETVFRFKGQSAPAVILTEIDFEQLDDNAIRRIFVGATRASLKLILVVSQRAARQFLGRLGALPES